MLEYVPFVTLLPVLFACNLAVAQAARRVDVRDGADSRPERVDDGRIRCPDCGAVDERDYRFCGQSVAELREPTAAVATHTAGERSPFR